MLRVAFKLCKGEGFFFDMCLEKPVTYLKQKNQKNPKQTYFLHSKSNKIHQRTRRIKEGSGRCGHKKKDY